MVENLAIEVGLFAIIAQESVERIGLAGQGRRRGSGCRIRGRLVFERRTLVAHAQGQFAQLVVAVGQAVRLQIEHQLQAVLGFAEKAIGVVENAIFLVGQAADVFERHAGP